MNCLTLNCAGALQPYHRAFTRRRADYTTSITALRAPHYLYVISLVARCMTRFLAVLGVGFVRLSNTNIAAVRERASSGSLGRARRPPRYIDTNGQLRPFGQAGARFSVITSSNAVKVYAPAFLL